MRGLQQYELPVGDNGLNFSNKIPKLYLTLLHYPVYNRSREVVSTAITNLDIHDIARAGCTYSVRKYFVVTPFEAQRQLVQKIIDHWKVGWGKNRIPQRGQAMDLVYVADSLEEVKTQITQAEGINPKLIATSANLTLKDKYIKYKELRQRIESEDEAFLIIMGTGWGLSEEIVEKCDYILPPVNSIWGNGYNHLSVRSATSIVLDRLLGEKE